MTEEEAKSKSCVFLTSAALVMVALLRGADVCLLEETIQKNTRCCGSECTMWRVRWEGEAGLEQHGYCGLAGKP